MAALLFSNEKKFLENTPSGASDSVAIPGIPGGLKKELTQMCVRVSPFSAVVRIAAPHLERRGNSSSRPDAGSTLP